MGALAEQGIGATVGCDYMGTVVQVGSKVTKDFKPGDRISGFVHGANAVQKEDGCFAEYCVAKADVQMKVPENISDEDASTLGIGITTVGQALYQKLGVPLPGAEKANYPILVYGGSTATGSLAIQFAILSGCQVVTTCSPRNFPFVKALGAAEAFDYNDPDCAKKIREFTGDKLTRAFDCISEGASPNICANSISSQGGQVLYLLPTKHDRTDVENKVFPISPQQPTSSFPSNQNNSGNARLHLHRRALQVGGRRGHARAARGLRVRQEVLGAGDEARREPADHHAPGEGRQGRARGRAGRAGAAKAG